MAGSLSASRSGSGVGTPVEEVGYSSLFLCIVYFGVGIL